MSIFKNIRKALYIIIGIIILLVAALLVIPYFFKDQLVEKIKIEANKNLNATLDFKDADISLLRSFPDVNISLSDLSLVGKDEFEEFTLYKAKETRLDLDIVSVFKKEENIKVHGVHLIEPDIHIVSRKDGKTNYNIFKENQSSSNASEDDFIIELNNYSISKGQIKYEDLRSDFYFNMKDLNHEGSGNFKNNVFDLTTVSEAKNVNLESGGINYLKDVNLNLDAVLGMDLNNQSYTLKENEAILNELNLNFEGFVQQDNNKTIIDIKFDAPSDKFKEFFSLLPNAYTDNYRDIKADGSLTLNGFVKGIYDYEAKEFPAYELHIDTKNGGVLYPGFSQSIDDINGEIHLINKTGNEEDLKITMPQFNFSINDNPIDASLKISDLYSDPQYTGSLKGKLVLEDFAKAYPIEDVSNLTGTIDADVNYDASYSDILENNYDKVQVDGIVEVNEFVYKSKKNPAIKINKANASFNPDEVLIPNFDATMGSSNLEGDVIIKNPLAVLIPGKILEIESSMNADVLDLNEWMTEDETNNGSTESYIDTSYYLKDGSYAFTLKGKANKVIYGDMEFNNINTNVTIMPSALEIENTNGTLEGSPFEIKGSLAKLSEYLFENGTLVGNLDFKSENLDINKLFGVDSLSTTSSNEDYDPYPVPSNLDLNINTDIAKLQYTDLDLRSLKGVVKIKNEELQIQDAQTSTLGGTIDFAGIYNSLDKSNPAFSLKYDISKLKIDETFSKISWLQIIAPIFKYIEGDLNSNLVMEGTIGKNMVPDFNAMTASGFLETLNGAIKENDYLKQASEMVDIKALDKYNLSETRNWFDMVDGKIQFQPFKYLIDELDVELNVSGGHSVNNELDYIVNAKIPRSLIEENPIGQAADMGLDRLRKEAKKLGISIEESAFLFVDFFFTGSLFKPSIDFKLVNAEGQTVKDVVKDKTEQIVETVKDTLQTIAEEKIEQVEDSASQIYDEIVDTVSTTIESKIDTLKEDLVDKVEEEIEAKFDSIIVDKTGAVIDTIISGPLGGIIDSSAVQDEIDKIKDKLKDFNPFKKKKKNN